MRSKAIVKTLFFLATAVFFVLTAAASTGWGRTFGETLGEHKSGEKPIFTETPFADAGLFLNAQYLYKVYAFDNSTTAKNNATAATPPDLTVSQSAPSSVNVGATFDYVLFIGNSGTDAADNFSVTFVVPNNLTLNLGSSTGGTARTYDSASRTITFTGVSVAAGPGATTLLTINVRAEANNTSGVVASFGANVIVDASGAVAESNENNNAAASDAATRILASNLTAAQAASPNPAAAGGDLTYTITITNDGNISAPSGVKAAFKIPANTIYSSSGSAQGGTSQAGGTVTFTSSAPINSGGTAVFTVVVRPNQAAAASGSVTSNGSDVIVDPAPPSPNGSVLESNESDNMANSVSTTVQSPDLTINQSGPSSGTVGSPVTYILTAGNVNGTALATNVTVYFPLPSGVTATPSDVTPTVINGFTRTFDGVNNRYVFSGGSLNAGQQITLTASFTPSTTGNMFSAGANVVIDPPNGSGAIIESNEGNNTAPSNVITTISVFTSAPTTQASNITFSNVQPNQMTVSWTNGNGAGRIVKINATNSFTNPADGSGYAANSAYGGAGEQVVFSGTGNSVTVTGLLPNTIYYFRVYEYNGSGSDTKYLTTTSAGNPNSQATTAAPAITSASSAAFNYGQSGTFTVTTTGNPTPSLSASGTLPSGVTFTDNGNGTATVQGTPTQAGTFTLTITANNGVAPNATQTFTLTVNAPAIGVSPATLPDGTEGTAYNQTISAAGGVAPYSFAMTAGTLPPGLTLSGSGVLSGTPTAAGTFNFTITATDANGFTGNRSYAVTINPAADNAPPDTGITNTPTNPSNDSGASFSFNGTDNVGVAGFECSLDGAAFATCSSPQSYANLSDGSHTFQVRSKDAAGNSDPTPASFTWTIDTAAPSVSSIARAGTNPTNAASVVFTTTFSESVTGVDTSDFTLTTTGTAAGTIASVSPDSGQTYTVTVNGVGGDGTIRLDLKASGTGIQDSAGNSISGGFTTGAAYTVDNTPPDTTITNAPPSSSDSASASFSFSGNDGGGSGVASFECSLDGAAFTTCSSPQTYTGLNQGQHTFRVRALDAVGNVDSTPASNTFTVTPPSSPPSLSINDVAKNEGDSGSTVFSFTVNLSSPAGAGGVTFDIATADNTATTADNDYIAKSLTGQTIPAGSSRYAFEVLVNGDAAQEPNETFFVNVTNVAGASVADAQGQGTIINDEAADLRINQSAPSSVNVGATFDYTLTVTNNGAVAAGNFSVTFVVPNNLTLNLSGSTGGATRTYDSGSRTITFTGVSAAPGATTLLTVNVKADANNASGSVTSLGANVVVDSSNVISESNENNNAAASDAATQILAPNLTISQTASPNPAAAGGNLTYTVTVTNSGNLAANGATATFAVPANTTFVSANASQGSVSHSGGTLSADFGTINAGGAAGTLTIVVKPNQAAAAANSVTSFGTNVVVDPSPSPNGSVLESNEGDNMANSVSTTIQSPDLRISQAGPSSGTINNPVTYTLTVTNPASSATAAATNIVVYFPLPTGVSVTPGTAAGNKGFAGTYDSGNRRYVFTGGTLNPGDAAALTVTVTPTTTGTLTSAGRNVVVDPSPPADGAIIESNEGNNFAVLTIDTAIGASAPAMSKISGQIRGADGRGIINAFITLSGGNLAEPIITRTNPFGYYRLPEVESGKTYILSVKAKGRTFNPESRTLNPSGNLSGEDFVSNE